MTRARVNLLLLAALILCIVLILKGGRNFALPNFEYMPDMAYSPAYAAFERNPNFADGKTLQRPSAGTIPRGRLPFHYDASPEDAERAGRELESPIPPGDAGALSRGAFVYSAFCQQCHGPAGEGDGPVARRGFPPPPSLLAEKARDMKDGRLFHILTYGQGNMSAYGSQLSRDDRWSAVAHVRILQARADRRAAAQGGAQTPGRGSP